MALSIFEETFGRERNRFSKVSRRDATTEHLTAITNAVQAVVDTFRDPRTGDRYVVSLSAQTEAYTSPGTKRIVVSYKPIFDKGLKVSTACTVMLGLVLHEIGHPLYTFPNLPAIEAAFGKPEWQGWGVKNFDQLAYTMLNVGDDARLEARMSEQLPIARDIFPTMLHWVALSTGMVGQRLRWTGKTMKMVDRVNFAARSVRYPWTATWSSDTATRAERAWWVNWGADFIALADHDGDGIVRLVNVALDRLRHAEEVEVAPEEPPITCGPMGPTGEKPGDEQGEDEGPGGKSKDPFGDDFDKDEDGDEPGQPGDEDDDEDGDDGDDDDDPDWDDDGDDESGPGQPGVEDEDEDDESEDGEGKDGEPDGDVGDPATDGQVGDDEPEDDEPKTYEQDFDAHDLDGNVDRINRGEDSWKSRNEGALLQRELDVSANTERISTTKWGSAKVEVRSIGQVANHETRARAY